MLNVRRSTNHPRKRAGQLTREGTFQNRVERVRLCITGTSTFIVIFDCKCIVIVYVFP